MKACEGIRSSFAGTAKSCNDLGVVSLQLFVYYFIGSFILKMMSKTRIVVGCSWQCAGTVSEIIKESSVAHNRECVRHVLVERIVPAALGRRARC